MGNEVAPGLCESEEAGATQWTLSHPARKNAITPEALAWIASRCRELGGEVVMLRGEGDGFCAGFDLTKLEKPPEGAPDAPLIAATKAMREADATFVALVHGHVIGAGLELAATCDFIVAGRSARFSLPAARLGVVYHAEGLARIHARFGALTRRLVLAGETIAAEEAHARGALDLLVPDDALEQRGAELLVALRAGAPQSITGNRNLLRRLEARELPDAILRAHEEARARAYASPDHAEAREAVAQRRPPRFARN